MNRFDLLSVFQALLGLYLVWAAVTGQGKVFQNGSVKKGREPEYRRLIRALCAVGGALLLLGIAADYSGIHALSAAAVVLMVGFVAVAIILVRRLTGSAQK